MASEEWRDIPGYEGLYQVSNFGRVRSLNRKDRYNRTIKGRLLIQCINKRWGRLQVGLNKDGKQKSFRVHNLVALAFLGLPPHGEEVNHIDGNKGNNCADNLEYVSHRENILHANRLGLIDKRGEKHHGAKLTTEQVLDIIARSASGELGYKLAQEYDVRTSQISRIINGKRWGHLARQSNGKD